MSVLLVCLLWPTLNVALFQPREELRGKPGCAVKQAAADPGS